MKYDNITRAVFLKRSNRFIAEVDIDGHREVVHVKNTGRCKELLIPGCEVWLTAPGTPDRKTKYDPTSFWGCPRHPSSFLGSVCRRIGLRNGNGYKSGE